MIRRLIYRLIIMVPVTLSILFVTIFLFYKLPAVQVLDSSELELGSERELAHLLGLQDNTRILSRSDGLFYIRATAGYLPDSYLEIPLMFQGSFRLLSKDVQNPEVMDQYARWVNHELSSIKKRETGSILPSHFVRILGSGSRAEFSKITEVVDQNLAEGTRPEIWNLVLEAPSLEDLPLLNVRWNGTHNVFHHYLTGIVSGRPSLQTLSGELVRKKFNRTVWWTLAYSIPALLLGWILVFSFVLGFYNKPVLLNRVDRWSVLVYSFPTFVLATLALVFLTSHRYGVISRSFPFPIFLETPVNGLGDIYRYYGPQLILPMILFAISPMLLYYRVFHEKIREIRQRDPSFQYLRHIGISSSDFRFRYLSRYLLVASVAVLSNLFVSVLGGSLIIEWIFNVPGLGRFMYESIMNYDIASTVYLIFIFTLVQQTGHIMADGLIDFFYSSNRHKTGLL